MLSGQVNPPASKQEDFASPIGPPKYKLINNLNLSGLGIRRTLGGHNESNPGSSRNLFLQANLESSRVSIQ